MDVVKKIQHFIKYWYIRYLLVTELYMVDTWEKITVQIMTVATFALFWYFNYVLINHGITGLRSAHRIGVS